METDEHKERWRSWLYWTNLTQFLSLAGGDGVQLATSRAAEFEVEVLAVCGGTRRTRLARRCRRPGTKGAPALAVKPVDPDPDRPSVVEAVLVQALRDTVWDEDILDILRDDADESPDLLRLAETLADLGKQAPVFGYELGTSRWQADFAWHTHGIKIAVVPAHESPDDEEAQRRDDAYTADELDSPHRHRMARPSRRTARLAPRHGRRHRPMTARLSLYRKAEEELYKLDRSVKAQFYDFCHNFRKNPDLPGLRMKRLKGDSRIFSRPRQPDYRALLTPTGADPDGTGSWLVIAVRHRKDVYEELQVAVNRVTGEIEFVDLAVVGDSALRRAGITLTPAEPEAAPQAARAVSRTRADHPAAAGQLPCRPAA